MCQHTMTLLIHDCVHFWLSVRKNILHSRSFLVKCEGGLLKVVDAGIFGFVTFESKERHLTGH